MKKEILNLTNIKYFCDTVRLGSVSAAAKVNFVTQSAISQGISKLEKSLGIPLVAHHPNRFRLTPHGERVYSQLLDILKMASEFTQNLSVEAEKPMGTLEFACTHSFALEVIPFYIKKFREEHPCIKVQFHLGKNETIKQMIKTGAIDFGILPDEGDLGTFEKRDIYSGSFKLYSSSKVKPSEQKKLPFIFPQPHAKEAILFKETYFRKFGKEPEAIMEVNSWEVISGLVAEGIGLGYFPDYIAKRKEHDFSECVFGLDPQKYQISAISPPKMKLRKSSEIFLSYFEAKASRK